MNDLPSLLRETFWTLFIPLLRQLAGTLQAWEQPTEANIRKVWAISFPDSPLDDDLLFAVTKLVRFFPLFYQLNPFVNNVHVQVRGPFS